MTELHVETNRNLWNRIAGDWISAGESAWKVSEPAWGIWGISEAKLGLLPERMDGLAAIELGCGTGYVSSWMARRGAKVTGIDVSTEQLATAKRLAELHGAEINFREGNAESIDEFDDSFDFAISEYGAAIWCDPELWLREAWRVLRSGGELVFVGHHPLATTCMPKETEVVGMNLHRSYRKLNVIDWSQTDDGGIEFNLSISSWFNLFKRIGFSVLDYHELYAPAEAEGDKFGIPAEWAKNYPSGQAWKLRKLM